MATSPDIAAEFAPWLVARAATADPMNELHEAFCERLVAFGLPLWRSSLGLELLHPEESGAQFIWTRAGSEIRNAIRQGVAASPDYLASPVKVVDDTGKAYRRRLDRPIDDMPMLETMRLDGVTDYFILPLPFHDTNRTATISFATKSDSGFAETDLAALATAAKLLSPYCESYVLRRIAIDLLNTYLGPRSGERVFNGAIDRGSFDVIEAVFLMADMRGFTRFSETQPIGEVITALNQFFDAIVGAVEAEGGEVLKYMGDGLLAIFPARGDLAAACKSALAAARAALVNLEAVNRARAEANHGPLATAMSLHAGEVAYGNIGARLRLDFTTIGSAINVTSRLAGLAKQLDVPVVVSSIVHQYADEPLHPLGEHGLRDIEGLEAVYTLDGASKMP
jgi:adenylate cyclase